MDEIHEKYQEKVARQIIAELGKKRMAGSFAPTIDQAKAEVITMIPEGSTVYRCGSTSLVEIGLWEEVKALPNVTVIDPYLPELSPEEGLEQRRRGKLSRGLASGPHAQGLCRGRSSLVRPAGEPVFHALGTMARYRIRGGCGANLGPHRPQPQLQHCQSPAPAGLPAALHFASGCI